MTIYGLYAREEGGALPVAALIRMLADLDIEEAGVRSSVSRMKRRGILTSRRHNGIAQYALSELSLGIIAEGDDRIFSPTRAHVADRWLLIVFSIPEAERRKRHTLRTQLTRMGFGQVAPGVWIAPSSLHTETVTRLRRLGLAPYVELFVVDDPAQEQLTDREMTEKISQWWDLPGLDALYGQFIERYEPMRRAWMDRVVSDGAEADVHTTGPAASGDDEELRQAFVDYIYMLTHWRRLPFMDPGLPLEYLPESWSGVVAERIFSEIHAAIGPLAHAYVRRIIHSGDEPENR